MMNAFGLKIDNNFNRLIPPKRKAVAVEGECHRGRLDAIRAVELTINRCGIEDAAKSAKTIAALAKDFLSQANVK